MHQSADVWHSGAWGEYEYVVYKEVLWANNKSRQNYAHHHVVSVGVAYESLGCVLRPNRGQMVSTITIETVVEVNS